MTFVLFFWPLYTTAEDFKSNDENEDFQEQIKFIPKLETLDMRCKEIQMHAKAEKKTIYLRERQQKLLVLSNQQHSEASVLLIDDDVAE